MDINLNKWIAQPPADQKINGGQTGSDGQSGTGNINSTHSTSKSNYTTSTSTTIKPLIQSGATGSSWILQSKSDHFAFNLMDFIAANAQIDFMLVLKVDAC